MDNEKLKQLRLHCGLTQQQVASVMGLDQSLFSKMEKGRRRLSNELADRLNEYYSSFLSSLNVNENIEAKFDWIRVRFPTNDWYAVIVEILKMDPDLFFYKHTGKFGYIESYYFGNIRVYNSKKADSRGVMIELSGEGCRNYEEILDTLNENWKDFFTRCRTIPDCNFTRVDCALDDKLEIVRIEDLIEKKNKGYIKTKFKVVRSIDEQQGQTYENNGKTIYFGSRKGTIHFAFYQKNYEQAKKLKKKPEDFDVKNRYEIRLMDHKANVFIEEYLMKYDCALLVRSVLDSYITFLDYDKNKKELVESKSWRNLIRNTTDIDFRLDPKSVSFEKSFRWLDFQGGRTLKKLKAYSDFVGDDLIKRIIENAELTEEDLSQIEQVTRDSEEVVLLDEKKALLNVKTGELLSLVV